MLCFMVRVSAQEAFLPDAEDGDAIALWTEQGHTLLDESFNWSERVRRIREQRGNALRDTRFDVDARTMFLDRNKHDGTESEAWAVGGSVGLVTGYFRDRVAVGATAYTSQKLVGDEDKDGTGLLAPGQQGYSVLGEIYADIRILEDLSFVAGRKGFDTPYINRNDVRMTPNTFQAAVLQGSAAIGEGGAAIDFGAGYFEKIKVWSSDKFVPMSEAAGAAVDRGVLTIGGRYSKGDFSLGAVNYYSNDIINIAYAEASYSLPLPAERRLRLALQYSDQRSVGADLLQGDEFSARQFGVRADLPVGPALFTVAYTSAAGNANMRSPWGGYPGYTSVQVENFNRDGERALLLRAGYEFARIEGLSAYALWVTGSDPDEAGEHRTDEYDLNLQWSPSKGILKNLALRLRYAVVEQHGGDAEDLEDLRLICSYNIDI